MFVFVLRTNRSATLGVHRMYSLLQAKSEVSRREDGQNGNVHKRICADMR